MKEHIRCGARLEGRQGISKNTERITLYWLKAQWNQAEQVHQYITVIQLLLKNWAKLKKLLKEDMM